MQLFVQDGTATKENLGIQETLATATLESFGMLECGFYTCLQRHPPDRVCLFDEWSIWFHIRFRQVIDDAATAFAYYDSGADLFCKHWGQAEQALQAAWPLPLLSHWPRLLPA